MKNFIILFILLMLTSCVSQIKKESIPKYYFYFDRTHPKMKVYGKQHELRHLYDLDNYDPIIFIPKDSTENEIKLKSLKNYNYKDYKWLNNSKPSDLGLFFHRDNIKKEYYLIEKRESNKILYLRKVKFIMEID